MASINLVWDPTKLKIREAIERDKDAILNIEVKTNYYPWSEEDLERVWPRARTHCYLADYNCKIVGFVIVEEVKRKMFIHNLGVLSHYRRLHVGTELIQRVLSKTHIGSFFACVRERDLDIQFFLKANGFKAVKVQRGFFFDSGEDGFLFEFKR